jgi:hypothetical protein
LSSTSTIDNRNKGGDKKDKKYEGRKLLSFFFFKEPFTNNLTYIAYIAIITLAMFTQLHITVASSRALGFISPWVVVEHMGTIVVHTLSLLKSLFTSLNSQQPHLHHSCGIHITVGKSDN